MAATGNHAYGLVTAAASDAGEPLATVQLFPMGEIKARDGRTWVLENLAHANQVVAASLQAAGGTDLMFDYDHQSFFGAKDGVGGTAPASGWIKKLWADPTGIYAQVAWTDAAAARLKAREYRYVSPLFTHDRVSRRITRLINGALVNTPAITELPAVASAQGGLTPQEPSMDLTQLAAALGLPATATLEEITAAAQTLQANATAAASAALAPVATALGLAVTAKPDEVTAAATAAVAGKVDPTKFAPIEVVTALQDQVKVLTDGHAASAAATEVDAAILAGKVSPALKDWAVAYATADLGAFKTFASAAPVIVPVGERKLGLTPEAASTTLTDEQAAAARVLGISEADMLATAKEETR